MTSEKLRLLIVILFYFGATACVSVNLKSAGPQKSREYQFQIPEKPFEKIKNQQTDQAWQNPRTGNTIAVLSECSDDKDPTLESLADETVHALTDHKILKTEGFNFQNRAALRTLVEGEMDGVPVQMDVVVLKKNSCAYTLTYMGRSQGIQKDRVSFEKFLKGFEIP